MMNLTATFTAPLTLSAHQLAQQFCRQHRHPQLVKQVYLNTLAVSAVEFYLRCLGIATDWKTSQSYDPLTQAAMDVADLNVKNHGKLECRPVLPGATALQIPLEVWTDRIGYVAVQLEPELREATILGFTTEASAAVPLSQLRSIDALLTLLHPSQQHAQSRVNLSQWLENLFEAGWQSLDTLLNANRTFAFRSDLLLNEAAVKRAKLINLGVQLEHQSVALLVAIAPTLTQATLTEAKPLVEILVQVHPIGGEVYLPQDFRMGLLSATGEILQEVQSRSHDNYMQLKRFQVVSGEQFEVQMTCHDLSVTESFVI